MHSIIFQVAKRHIYEFDNLDIRHISEGDGVSIGYTYEVDEATREKDIRYLAESVLPEGMFTLNPDLTLTYNGGFNEWRKGYLANVREKASAITEGTIMEYIGPVYQLEKAILNPLNSDLLFVTDFSDRMGIAEKSRELMRFVMKLKPGDIVHIGSVVGYHN